VIGLGRTNGDQRMRSMRLGLCQNELQLTSFVPSKSQAGQIIPLYQQAGST
jgi:hypothetical protein